MEHTKVVRSIVGVVVGYVVMAGLVFATFSAAYLAMGVDRAFHPGSYEVTTLWLATSFALAFLAAVAGGFACAAISKLPTATVVLASIIVVLGLAMAVPVMMEKSQGESPVRSGDVGNLEAMQNAKSPLWVALANPIVGALGVLVGARLVRPLASVASRG